MLLPRPETIVWFCIISNLLKTFNMVPIWAMEHTHRASLLSFLLLKLDKWAHLCMEVTEMVSAVSVPVVSSFWCPLSLLEVLFIALQHKQRKANTTVCREERNNARQPSLPLSCKKEKNKFSFPLTQWSLLPVWERKKGELFSAGKALIFFPECDSWACTTLGCMIEGASRSTVWQKVTRRRSCSSTGCHFLQNLLQPLLTTLHDKHHWSAKETFE